MKDLYIKKININRCSVLIAILLLLATTHTFAGRVDSSAIVFQKKFIENIHRTNELCFPADSVYLTGKFRTETIAVPAEFYAKLNFSIFKTFSITAADYLEIYKALPQLQKQNLLKLFVYYEEIAEKELKNDGLPVELKFLAPALSALNCAAIDNQKRAGLWQLTHFQAVLNGLLVNQLVDERLNLLLATRAFAAEMKKNFSLYKSPEVAVLAYYLGNAKVRNTLENLADSADFNQLVSALPAEASQLIGAFQASVIFFSENKFRKTTDIFAKKSFPDTVFINKQLHFKQVANVLSIPVDQLSALNPQFRFQIVPGNSKQLKLALPAGKRDDFTLWQDSVYNLQDSSLFAVITPKIEYPQAPGRQYRGESVKNLELEGKTKIKYTLKNGDVLGVIAEEFEVSVEDLMYWNNIRNERKIQAGKNIDIFVDNERAAEFKSLSKSTVVNKSLKKDDPVADLQNKSTPAVFTELDKVKKVEHVVKTGESPFVIAKKYPGVNPDDILLWNNISDTRKIQIGQTLIIYLKN